MIAAGHAFRLCFRVEQADVDAFAEVTGDHNALHVNASFGRRSAYRRPIVHGMLPVTFLSALPLPAHPRGPYHVEQLTGAFVHPVFAGDRLRIAATVREAQDDGALVVIDYLIENDETGVLITRGAVTVHAGASLLPDGAASERPCLVTTLLAEGEIAAQDITKGLLSSLRFSVAIQHARALHGWAQRAHPEPFEAWLSRWSPTELLACALLSTHVGMSIPGRYATFSDFTIQIDRPLAWEQEASLTGTVAFFSKSTQTVVQDITLEAGGPLGKGKVSSAVGEAPPSMPSIAELQRAGVGLDLRDRVVLITGASRGLGETTAKVLGLLGARVGVSYLSGGEDAARIVREIEEAGGQALAIQADVTDAASVEAMVAAVHDRFGRIDVLVNNAVRDTRPIPFSALTWDEMQADLDVTLKGAFHCCKAVAPRMAAAGGGRIVNVGTVITEIPQAGQMKYVVSKSALVGFTRSLAFELAASNVLVNLVVPSMVETDLSQSIPRMLRAGMKNDTPMRRLATPLDVARAIVFLASDLSGYTTGQKIMVTGGSPPFL